MKVAAALAIAALPLVSAAPAAIAERACNATALSSGHYMTDYLEVHASGLKAEPGQTLTATVVVSPRFQRRAFRCDADMVSPGSRDLHSLHRYQH